MTAITDAKLVIETLIGHTMTGTALTRIADAFMKADPHGLVRNGSIILADPENPTNEEKASLVLKTLIEVAQHVVGNVADKLSDDDAAATKAANRASAVADLE